MTGKTIALILMSLQAASTQSDRGPHRAAPEEPLASYVFDNDYPMEALAQGIGGTVGFRLVIDPQGRVIDCKIETSSGNAALDAQTCAIMTARPRFRPARDRSGRPVMDTHVARIRWRIDDSLPDGVMPFAFVRTTTFVRRSPEGEISCVVDINGTRQPTGGGCRLAPPLLAIAQQLDPSREMAIVESFVPDGIGPTPVVPYGQLLAESEAEWSVDADGAVSNCRTVARAVHVDGAPTPPDLCAQPSLPRYPPGSPNRRARFRISLFIGAVVAS